MVLIDNVYQKVLALLNKEQRGYVTPQEFNLMADKAQMDIYETYFHDLKTAHHKPKNNTNFADEMEIIEEKLHAFYIKGFVLASNGAIEIPNEVYRVKNIITPDNKIVEEVSEKEYYYIINNPLTKPTSDRPICVRQKNVVVIGNITGSGFTSAFVIDPPNPDESLFYNMTYWKRPTRPNWAYVVVNKKALYNVNNAINFELHPSEEETLVNRILQLSGMIIEKPNVIEVAMTDSARTKQEQND